MPATDFGNIAEELGEIKNQFEDLLRQCEMLLSGTGMIERRAQAYWIAHIEGALEGRGGSMVTMQETIDELSTPDEDEGAMPLSHRTNRSRKTAKMDLMTGFTGKKMPDPDLGLKGNDYFEKWTTVALPDTGKDPAIDDEQQPTGGGAPATVIPGSPLKTPMEAQDVTRPKIRESPEASRRKAAILRKVASEIRLLDHITARRLMAAADEISYDALSTATLPVAGDDFNDVDDYHDQFGHGTLSFFGTDPAKSTSLTRESSRRIAAEGESRTPCEVAYRVPGKPWKRKTCKTEAQLDKLLQMLDEEGAERQFRQLEPGDTGYVSPKASRLAAEDFTRCEISFKYPGDNWDKVVCTSKDEYDKKMKELKEGGAEVKVRHFDNGEVDTNLQYANRGASRRRVAESTDPKGLKGNIDMKTSLGLVEQALQGKYDRGAVAHILKADYDRIMGLLKNGQGGQNGEMVPGQQGQHATASRRRASGNSQKFEAALQNTGILADKEPIPGGISYVLSSQDFAKVRGLVGRLGASVHETQQEGGVVVEFRNASRSARTQGDPPLKPEPTVGDQDGPGADGAGGFYRERKAPLQETMTAQDVERPKIRENPEAGRLASLWDAFRSELIRQASGTGKWNSGRYAIEARDYGDSVEIQASVVDRENLPMPVGSILFSKIHDSPRGRFATVEVNDGILENRTREFTLQRPRQASKIVRRLVEGVVQTSKDLIDGITV